ncbi:MAG: GNAT family N-acetyltransferase [Vampirovibrionales bacterium]|nr:GNAT family N-acetyltransferase [Vampirovibrionales bacterium]
MGMPYYPQTANPQAYAPYTPQLGYFPQASQAPQPLAALTSAPEEIEYKSAIRELDEDTFTRLASASGWDKKTQGALDTVNEPLRAANVLHPQPVVVAAANADGDVIAAAGGTNYGEYAFLQYVMVEPEYHRQNVGPSLIREFQQRVNEENGGETSIATLSADHTNIENPSHRFYLQSGFKPLPNALFLQRGQQVR